MLEQLCEARDPGCRYFIGGVANTLYYSAKGTICFPMTETNGLKSIDLNPLIEKARYALSKVAFDQDAAPVLFNVWLAAYPCLKP
jgi:3,4-dihydroxy-2-butanone 4-phosphate synthase